MKRRSFFGALVALSLLAKTWRSRPLRLADLGRGQMLTYRCYDGIRPTRLVVDKYAPSMTVIAIGGVAFTGLNMGLRIHRQRSPDCMVEMPGGRRYPGWRLDADMATEVTQDARRAVQWPTVEWRSA